MKNLQSNNQTKLFGLNHFMNELIHFDNINNLPNKILVSGQKGLGKCTLAYHFINYILSKNEEYSYDKTNFEINPNNQTFKTILNKSNPNLILIDLNTEKKFIDINQIRGLITNLNKSSFNNKPRFVLIDNIELLNINSINALLKILEEPSFNVHFILINSNKKILPTLSSRCINFKIFLTNNECLDVTEKLLECKLDEIMNKDLVNYYFTPGIIYNLIQFAEINQYDLFNINLKDFLRTIIKNSDYKKDSLNKYLLFDLIEFYFRKINSSLSTKINDRYSYFINKISNTKKFNLDEESVLIEFEEEVLNG
jgi:DNA polymerase III subunit delta'